MANPEEWERLARLLDDDETVAKAVTDAVRSGKDPWEALLDGLDEAGVLAYLKADDTGVELTDALAQLPRVYAIQPDLDEATDTDDLLDATLLADEAMRANGFRLVLLREDDDSWPLVVLPVDRLADVVALTGSLGHEARAAK